MLSKIAVLLAVCALLATGVIAGDLPTGQAYLRVLLLDYDVEAVSLLLQDGRTVLTNLTPGAVSDYMPYAVNRSTFITLSIKPVNALSMIREWPVPPLAPGHYTLTLIGSHSEGTLELVLVSEDSLCAGRTATGSCVILINNIEESPPLTMLVDNLQVVEDARYRQIVVGAAAADSYRDFRIVDRDNPQNVLFDLERGFFEPNVIYLYSLVGTYPGRQLTDFNIGTIRRATVDTMTFLRGLTANLQLTDGDTLFATENIVAILQEAGYDTLLANEGLALTVFAPTDGAVLDVAATLYGCAIANPDAMRTLILNHVLIGSYTSAQLVGTQRLSTMAGTTHTFSAVNGGFMIDNAVRVAEALRYPTTNGNVYLIDQVLIPAGFVEQYCEVG